ncbi:hypothetical protein [Carboxydothermus ferrireducens]|uniref:Uncharacterized protein n=1 Tax=Carboxydothermus ferrireducens DSM 11255 TaxID=1119529 RepID=A0ABX2R7G7_9THEO|nr:hypothetical protein [Carboxydothermus ferrireducens]NYE57111.1 hypothetical protein [Carboxydothermus ferrireducens DSM 11255]
MGNLRKLKRTLEKSSGVQKEPENLFSRIDSGIIGKVEVVEVKKDAELKKPLEEMNFDELWEELIRVANREYDGHFMLLRFTTNWRCCFGTVEADPMTTLYMAEGTTLEEAIRNALKNRVDADKILKMAEEAE